MPVLFDIQGVQSRAHGERGIARYLNELATALEHDHSELVSRFVLNRQLPVPPNIGSLGRADKLDFTDRVRPGAADGLPHRVTGRARGPDRRPVAPAGAERCASW